MKNLPRRKSKHARGGLVTTQTRKKLGATQEELAAIFGVSRASISHLEWGRRNGNSQLNTYIANIFQQFLELETGVRPSNRTVETALFLNEEYKKVLPKMEAMEKDCRNRMKELQKQMTAMQEKARDAEHGIIVLTKVIQDLKDEVVPAGKNKINITGVEFLKQDAYDRLLTCWEPEQAKLQGKIEAIAGEAKALRRYRTRVVRKHDPFGRNKDK